jgi:NADH:ubiquinone oxidoreductase subunit 2 (subunit N)
MKKVVTLSTLAALALPLVSFAEDVNDISGLGTFIIDTINNIIVPVLFAVAFIVFLWGAFTTFILGAGSEEAKDKGKSLMLYSLIGFFVMVSIWGLVNILVGSIGLNNAGPSGGVPSAGVEIQ